jgi:hypothetical protein
MKRIYLSLLLMLALVTGAMAQVSAQSTDVKFDGGSLSIQYVNDGFDGAAAIKFNDIGFNNFAGIRGLNLNALVVNPRVNTEQNSYFGAILNYTAFSSDRVNVNFGVGVKGFDITSVLANGSFGGINTNVRRQVIWSIGASFRL